MLLDISLVKIWEWIPSSHAFCWMVVFQQLLVHRSAIHKLSQIRDLNRHPSSYKPPSWQCDSDDVISHSWKKLINITACLWQILFLCRPSADFLFKRCSKGWSGKDSMDPGVSEDSVCISRLLSPTSFPFISFSDSQKHHPAWPGGLSLHFWSLPLSFWLTPLLCPSSDIQFKLLLLLLLLCCVIHTHTDTFWHMVSAWFWQCIV